MNWKLDPANIRRLKRVLPVLLLVSGTACDAPPRTAAVAPPDTIRVVSIKYFPVSRDVIDIDVTGDWGESLEFTRQKVDSISTALTQALGEGTRYHGYSDATASAALHYQIVREYEVLAPSDAGFERIKRANDRLRSHNGTVQRRGLG